jgi:N-acetylglucosaminyldiphosphoundecaprenol N-acetyl-beta-D-mannosaminyltransferase
MEKYFNVQLEFDHSKLEQTIIENSENNKGYCCFIDSNLLVESHLSNKNGILEVLNNSLVNSCDGSYLAMLATLVYKKKLKPFNGPKFFDKYIYFNETHCIIGNTKEVFEKIKSKVSIVNGNLKLHFIPLPFLEVDQFDYLAIAKKINIIKPRYIWVSLGAPKQEFFMYKLLPHLESGVMLGVGAALNYFSGEIKDIPRWAIKFHLIWFFRILTEPKKQMKRVLKIIKYYPKIYSLGKKEINLAYHDSKMNNFLS